MPPEERKYLRLKTPVSAPKRSLAVSRGLQAKIRGQPHYA